MKSLTNMLSIALVGIALAYCNTASAQIVPVEGDDDSGQSADPQFVLIGIWNNTQAPLTFAFHWEGGEKVVITLRPDQSQMLFTEVAPENAEKMVGYVMFDADTGSGRKMKSYWIAGTLVDDEPSVGSDEAFYAARWYQFAYADKSGQLIDLYTV